MDLSKVTVAKVINSRKPEPQPAAPKLINHLKYDFKKEKLTLSKQLFVQLDLDENSLNLGYENADESGEILIIVCPANTGKIAKKGERAGNKGQSFTIRKLNKDLTKRGWTGGKYNLELVGELDNHIYYKLVEFHGEANPETDAAAEKAAETSDDSDTASESEEVAQAQVSTEAGVSFN